jgi:Glycosyltransferase family 87
MGGESRLRRLQTLTNLGIAFLLILAIAGLVWANYQFTSKRGEGVDFAIYWTSARTMLFDGATPYSELASLKSQNLIYGLGGRPGDPPSRLDLPLHIATLIIPFSLISNYPLARALWMSLLEIALVVTIFICLRTFRWNTNPVVGAEIIFFALFSVYGLWALVLGNAIILAGLFLAAVLLALRDNHVELAGILLGLSTFKFMSVGLFIVFIIFWVTFQHKWRLLIPFVMTFVILVMISFFFSPNWFVPYAQAVFTNLKYADWMTPSVTFRETLPFAGNRLGWLLSGFLTVILLVEWWLARKRDFQQMAWTASLTIALSPLLGLPTYPQNHILLIISFIFGLSVLAHRWKSSSSVLISVIIIIVLLLTWITVIFAANRLTTLYFLFPVVNVVFLYWVRWWAVIGSQGRSTSFNNST